SEELVSDKDDAVIPASTLPSSVVAVSSLYGHSACSEELVSDKDDAVIPASTLPSSVVAVSSLYGHSA
ncbi:hypothetical protein V5H41_29955, partial [Salmonella enterica]